MIRRIGYVGHRHLLSLIEYKENHLNIEHVSNEQLPKGTHRSLSSEKPTEPTFYLCAMHLILLIA